jgi:hypothetical protein
MIFCSLALALQPELTLLRECGCLGACDFLRRVQSEVTKIVEYQEER